ncbi:protein rolling stone isoform X2 [Lingula anatina]|uniref:Protein rolling stone isoform X2 n=1 Tax=Lingula anatina TaxID=7574 RepID=A0A1S3KHZ1_LINAN|nr:protein rolling stone isoform X2 [Lingula anatina]|eukprot:XP_013422112.1 protein rolling stone isoform X2 [Lingula anatina]
MPPPPRHTRKHMWERCPPLAFVVYRLCLALYFLSWLIYTGYEKGIHYKNPSVFFVYFTHWVLILLTSSMMVSAGATLYHYLLRSRGESWADDITFDIQMEQQSASLAHDQDSRLYQGEDVTVRVITNVKVETPWYCKLSWVLYNMTFSATILVFLIYWPLLYDGHFMGTKFNNHAMTALVMLADVFVTKIPIRLLHMVYPLVFVTVYTIFNIIYSLSGGLNAYGSPYIYKFLDWRKPLIPITVVACLGVVGIPVLQVTIFALYRLRLFLHKRCR